MALVFHVFIAVAVMVMAVAVTVCGRHGIGPYIYHITSQVLLVSYLTLSYLQVLQVGCAEAILVRLFLWLLKTKQIK